MTFKERMAHHYGGEKRGGESNQHPFLRDRSFYRIYDWGRLRVDEGVGRVGEKTSLTFTCEIGDTSLEKGDKIVIYTIGYNSYSRMATPREARENDAIVTFDCAADVELTLEAFNSFCRREIILTVRQGVLRRKDLVKVTLGEGDTLTISEIARPLDFHMDFQKTGEKSSKHVDQTMVEILSDDKVQAVECDIDPIVPVGGRGNVSIRLLDQYENPVDHAAEIRFDASNQKVAVGDFDLQEGDEGYRKLKHGLVATEPGFHILRGSDAVSGVSFSSNPVKFLTGEPERKLFFGDIHNHDHLSPGLASPAEAYEEAVKRGLHFLALPVQTQSGNLTEDKWLIANYMAERHNVPGRFVTFPAIEWQHYAFGHKVICFMNPDQPLVSPYDARYDTPDKLFKALSQSDAFIQVHHTGYKLDCHVPGTDWEYSDEALQTVLEVCSCHGSSEKPDSERQLNNPGSGYLCDVLSRGRHIGVIGGSDGHNGRPVRSVREPRQFPGGMACLYAKELTRPGLFEAFRSRRCYGTTGVKMIMEFEINSEPMGAIFTCAGERHVKIAVAGTDTLVKVEIIKNNDIIFSESSNNEIFTAEITDEPGAKEDFYYLKVTQKDGEMGWTSPIWVGEDET